MIKFAAVDASLTDHGKRIELLDALRGFALLGVFAANLFIFSGHVYMTDEQHAGLPNAAASHVVHLVEKIFVENKFIGLFSFLFGVSFWLFLERAAATGADGVRLFYRRVFWLFVIGGVHAWLFWLWDILRFYALWGMLLPLFLRLSNRALLSTALFMAVLAPALIGAFRSFLLGPSPSRDALNALALQTFSNGSYMDVLKVNWLYDWELSFSISPWAYQAAVFGRLLLGLFAARLSMHVDIADHLKLFKTLFVGCGIVGVGLNILTTSGLLGSAPAGSFWTVFGLRLMSQVGNLSLTLAYAAGFALLFKHPWRKVFLAFAPAGRMALTLFLSQTLIGLWLFYGYMPGPHLMGRVGPLGLVPIWIIGFGLQMLFAAVWLRHFKFGPAEWLWRSLTYWKVQPLRLRVLSAESTPF